MVEILNKEDTTTVKRRYNYGFKVDKTQEVYFANTFGCARVVYNDAIAIFNQERKNYQEWKRKIDNGIESGEKPKDSTSGELQKTLITAAKKTEARAFLAKNILEEPVGTLTEIKIPTVCLQQSVRNAFTAKDNFIRSITNRRQGKRVGAPKFKKKSNTDSIHFTKKEFKIRKLNSKWIELHLRHIPNVLKIKTKRKLPSAPSSLTIAKNANGNFSVSFVVDIEKKDYRLPIASKNIGIDIGLTTLAVMVDSNGFIEHVENPRFMRNNAKKLANLQRNFARKEKGSKNRIKQAQKIAKLHQIIANNRRHNNIKIANKIVAENQIIVLETLNIEGLKKKSNKGRKRLGKSISDAGWGGLVDKIVEKAELSERTVQRAGRFYASSQICSSCKENTGKKPLRIRQFTCQHCNTHHDRDENAAKNLLQLAGE